EERAIRERGFQQRAFEFVTLIPLDKGKTPEWFPSTQIYLDWDRLKDDGAVATLRERIIRAGGHAPEESIAARSARLQRAQVRENERVAFLGSSVGREAAFARVADLFDALERIAPECGATVERTNVIAALRRDGYTVSLAWQSPFSNTLERADLLVQVWRG